MSSQSTKPSPKQQLSDDKVSEYLIANPDFFVHNEASLEHLTLTHDSGTAVSLIERQVVLLRKQKKELENQLTGLIQAARNNEQIVSRMQRFTLEMIYAQNLDDVVASCQNLLRSDFKADFAVIKLIGTRKNSHFTDPADIDSRSFAPLFKKRQPICGRITDNQRNFLFAENSDDVNSAVIIPLQTTKDLGILALGSMEKTRFTPGMGTLFLSYLGELVTATIAKHIDEKSF